MVHVIVVVVDAAVGGGGRLLMMWLSFVGGSVGFGTICVCAYVWMPLWKDMMSGWMFKLRLNQLNCQ